MKEKGFSLIELLAVIVILAVIALIATPLIMGIINDSKLNGLKDSAYGILKSANLYFSQYEPETNIRFDIEENQVTSKDAEEMIQYKGYVKEGAVIVNATGKITMCITDGKNSVYKNYKDKSIVVVENDSCYIPENQAIVYLANGGATLDELDNAELTDLVTSLQEEISALNREINTLKTSKANKSDLDSIETQIDNNVTKNELATIETQIESIGTIANSTLEKLYPVGSIYTSVNNTNPSTIYGGTWVAFGTGRTLVGVDPNQSAFNSVEKTGGSNIVSYTPSGTVGNHTLTIEEIPNHTHEMPWWMWAVSKSFNSGNYHINSATNGNAATYNYSKSSQEQFTTSTGGGQPHNHSFSGTSANISTLQPYITVYMWKRTA